MRTLTAEQWAQNRGAAKTPSSQPAEVKKEEEKKKKKNEKIPKGQVVAVPPGNKKESEDAKYLAESANTVEKESRAREQSPFYRNAMPRRTTPNQPVQGAGSDQVERAQIAGNNGTGNDDRPLDQKGESQRALEIPDIQPRQEIALKTPRDGEGPGAAVSNRVGTDAVKGNSNRLRINPGGGESAGEASSAGRAGAPGIAHLMPSEAVLDKVTGAAPNDHLSEVEEGDGTYLNTKEWKYSSFFNRVKQSVGMHWDPGSKLRQRDPTGNIYGGRDRYTVVNVSLDQKGMLRDIFVEKSCGLDFLDLEAVQSFQRAQPFPNPPPGLGGDDSLVRFTFGFYLEMGSAPRLRLFRNAN
jgi:TonB family protein